MVFSRTKSSILINIDAIPGLTQNLLVLLNNVILSDVILNDVITGKVILKNVIPRSDPGSL